MSLIDFFNNEKHILFIKGVAESDYSDDQMSNKYYSSERADISELYKSYQTPKYDTLSKLFSTYETWKKKTNIKCWYCESAFDSVPVFIPKYINLTPKGKTYDVYGNFCTFVCAKTFLDMTKDNKYWEKYEQLKMLYEVFKGKKINDIPSGPNKYELQQYGGKVTSSEFKEKIHLLNLTL